MLVAMVSGIVVGLGFMAIRENVGADSALWSTLNSILFQNVSASGGESALGLFYIGGQLFIRALQLVIVSMVFSSVVMAICEVNEARTLGRIAGKTIGWFMMTTTKELGADPQIASFVLPPGMTINMDGTAIMQVVATLFVAGDSVTSIAVAKSEGKLDVDTFNK